MPSRWEAGAVGGRRFLPRPVCFSRTAYHGFEQISLKELTNMLWTILVVLLVLWALGLVTSYTMGGLIHVLLVVALVMVVFQVIQGRRVV